MGPVLQSCFTDYTDFHRAPGNKRCHYVGIPVIVLSVLALLAQVPLVTLGGLTLTLADLVLLATIAYYLTLDVALGVLMLAFGVLFDAAARLLPPALASRPSSWAERCSSSGTTSTRRSRRRSSATWPTCVGPPWILGRLSGRA